MEPGPRDSDIGSCSKRFKAACHFFKRKNMTLHVIKACFLPVFEHKNASYKMPSDFQSSECSASRMFVAVLE
jgi:hypothetical protein